MHMPDGVLDPTVLVGAGAVSVAAVAWSARELRRRRPRVGVALAGAGGLLLAHMADVPLGGTYTGHLIGGTLLAVAAGPALALATMAAVLAVEALLLGDGGIAALGVNMLVMGVVGVLVGYGVYRGVVALGERLLSPDGGEPEAWVRVVGAGVGAFVSVAASAATLVGVSAIGGAATGTPVAALLQHYALWGALEAVLTVGLVAVGLVWWRANVRLHEVVPPLSEPRALDGSLDTVR